MYVYELLRCEELHFVGTITEISLYKIESLLLVSSLLRLSRPYILQSPTHANAFQWLCVLRMYSYAFLYTPALLLFFPTFTTSRSFLHHHLPHVM